MRQPTAEKRSTHALPARIAAMERVVEAANILAACDRPSMPQDEHDNHIRALRAALAALDEMEGE